ncbi:hypothetical protein [Niallia taxi]|uniref:hypothetical protein n=1 Tax=Niallia taxi TaxID=2499688 RepID=UPI0015F5B410|nr:hypothetical protein [Niallia taxi]
MSNELNFFHVGNNDENWLVNASQIDVAVLLNKAVFVLGMVTSEDAALRKKGKELSKDILREVLSITKHEARVEARLRLGIAQEELMLICKALGVEPMDQEEQVEL